MRPSVWSRSSDTSMAQVARDLGIYDKTLRNWVRSDRYCQEQTPRPGQQRERADRGAAAAHGERPAQDRTRDLARGVRHLPVSRCGEPHSLRLRVAPLRAKRLCRGLKVSRSGLLHLVLTCSVRPRGARCSARCSNETNPPAFSNHVWRSTGARRTASETLSSQAGGSPHDQRRSGRRGCLQALAHRTGCRPRSRPGELAASHDDGSG